VAKKSIIQRQLKRQKLFQKYKAQREIILQELKLESSFSEKLALQKRLQKMPRNSIKIRLRNRCWKTGRGRAFYRDFGVCRHVLREMAHEGLLPGVIKSSW
jgi:small subunit ribosomal protein S14